MIDAIAELEERDTKVAFLQRRIAALFRNENQASEENTRAPEEVASVEEAITAARQHLSGIVIPGGVDSSIEELDQTLHSRTWGNCRSFRPKWRRKNNVLLYDNRDDKTY